MAYGQLARRHNLLCSADATLREELFAVAGTNMKCTAMPQCVFPCPGPSASRGDAFLVQIPYANSHG
jgi:hypothetical protein